MELPEAAGYDTIRAPMGALGSALGGANPKGTKAS
jgi:hypothetical protein